MPDNSWSKSDTSNEFDTISSFISDWSDPEEEEEEFRDDFFEGLAGRRRKAALVLTTIWGIVIGLHLFSWGHWLVIGLASILVVQGFRLVLAELKTKHPPLTDEYPTNVPKVSLLVSAKNEEAVIANLVQILCNLDYPKDKYEVWIIDDHSTDSTGKILDELAQAHEQLKVLHRPAGAGGGKSGALNQVLPLTTGEIVAVFDADAKVSPDLLKQVVPIFNQKQVGAVQTRKAIANSSTNFWTKGQSAEMALDSYLQRQRIAIGGIGELRGNGQFVRRSALDSCGGWNEQTITDDLDLTLCLHLDGWKIDFLQFPPVEEEGVERAIALWHQRNRWAEGGYQRYLDYWKLIISNRMGIGKTWEMISFMLIQYLLPIAALPDLLMAVALNHSPVLMPITTLSMAVLSWGMLRGLRQVNPQKKLDLQNWFTLILEVLRGMIYMAHWLVIMASTTARMSIRPKRLKWVKTVHQGSHFAMGSGE